MQLAPLTFKSIRARAVVLKLKRPVVARIATITDWPVTLIDLFTEAAEKREWDRVVTRISNTLAAK